MKKIILVIVGILVLGGVWQYYSANLVRSSINEIFQSSGAQVVSSDTNGSLFSTQNSSIVRFKDIDLKINSSTSHILGITRTKGDIEILSEPIASFAKAIFKGENAITFEMFGDDLSVDLAEIELDDEGAKINIAKSNIKVNPKSDESVDIQISAPLISLSEYNENIVLKDVFVDANTKEMPSSLRDFTSKSTLSAGSVEYAAAYFPNIKAQNIKIQADSKSQNEQINSKIIGDIKQIFIDKTALMNLKFDLDLKELDSNDDYFLGAKSQVVLNSLSLANKNGGKISANASFTAPEYQRNANPFINSQIFGEINATQKISQMFELGSFVADFEDGLIKDGVIISNDDGYSLRFKSDGDDVIFNDNVSLAKIIANAFGKMLLGK